MLLPPTSEFPVPPKGFVPAAGVNYASIVPRGTEAMHVSEAVTELTSLADNYSAVFGPWAPPYADTLTLLGAASAWTVSRENASTWDTYALNQEGLAWTLVRPILAKLGPLLQTALATNSGLTSQMPNLIALLQARQVSAKKSASTRAANKKSVANGEAPTHGSVGKARQRKAEKALYAAQSAANTGDNGSAKNGTVASPPPTASVPTVTPATVATH